jgi:hypothetical protein
MQPHAFEMYRTHDESGVSGTGKVLEGVQFNDDRIVIRWTTDGPNSIVIYDKFEDFVAIHITPHPTNKTVINWADGRQVNY